MTVGAAGRRLAPIAAIMNDKGRALGRGGGGAVFGSKNLVAIVVAGSVAVESAAPDALRPTNIAGSTYKAHAKLRVGKLTKPPEQFGILSSMGTAGLLGMLSQYDELIHCNFRDTSHVAAEIERIGGEALASHPAIRVRRRACYLCPIGCTRDTELLDKGGAVVDRGEGPEFETVAMFGANLAVYDLEPITEANYLCNRLGLDTIAAGGTIAALMEIFEVARATRPEARTDGERALMADVAAFAQRMRGRCPGRGRRRSVRAGVRERHGAGPARARDGPRRGRPRARARVRVAPPGGALRPPGSGDGREGDGDPGLRPARDLDPGDVLHDRGARRLPSAGRLFRPDRVLRGVRRVPGHEVGRRGPGGAQLRLPEHGVRRARRVRLRRVLDHARRVREHAERRDRARDEGERSRNGLAPGADARAPLQPALRIHGGRRLAPRALLPRTDRRRGGECRLPRRRIPRDARRVLRVARLGRAGRAARGRDARTGARRGPRGGGVRAPRRERPA